MLKNRTLIHLDKDIRSQLYDLITYCNSIEYKIHELKNNVGTKLQKALIKQPLNVFQAQEIAFYITENFFIKMGQQDFDQRKKKMHIIFPLLNDT
ncbi:hypothetical protein COY87_03785 [Candidatus Roizmanbacteria bacterium CG_4_10_14_0_8_um_filter_33_9]|uniref:Uncharacterized protein n=1 Tax=Candidatus Roizmanbacteria bacterium CG_4_10_14_0_8_um_filter_33_9 TaxID=1974826 RepID=A0A2M7QIT8_9BACT|nr:MAG: hypothetical protein COY87_03785 [Candidatus Roizmanbacteria bacterium CG_4_10_14_0_8_um_filter_33_9]